MSAQHTPGSIRYDYEPGYCGELIAQDGMTVAAFVNEPSEADARRLVASWNACNGVSTEHLEDDAVRKLIQDRDLLLAQRDELLEALQDYDDAFTGFDPSSKESRHRMRLAVIKARAAIAKAIG